MGPGTCRMRPSAITWPGAGRRSASRKAAARRRCSSRSITRPAWRPRSTSGSCGCGWPGCWSSATCSRSGCRIRGKAVHLVSATCGQEAFLEGHVHAFTVLGGVPAGQIRYDNLTPAVTRVLRKGRGEDREPAVDGVPVALPVRGVLLRARHRGRPREGRRRGPGRVLPPQLPGPGPGSGLPRGTERADRGRRAGRGRPPDRGADPHHRPGLRRRGAPAGPAAGRAVRDRAAADPPRRPVQPGHRADEPLLGAGPADRPPGAGRAALLGAGHLRRGGTRPPVTSG